MWVLLLVCHGWLHETHWWLECGNRVDSPATDVAAVATPGVVVVATQLQVVQLALFKDCNVWSMLLGYRHTVWCMLGTGLGSAIEWCHLHQQIADGGGGLKPT